MHSRRWSPALVCPRGPVGDSGQSPHQVTRKSHWETVSLGLPGHSGETLGTPRRPTNREPPRDPPHGCILSLTSSSEKTLKLVLFNG